LPLCHVSGAKPNCLTQTESLEYFQNWNTIVVSLSRWYCCRVCQTRFQKQKNTFSFNCYLSQKLHWKYTSHWGIWEL